MKCENCKSRESNHTTTVYYGKIVGQYTTNYKSGNTTKSVTEFRYERIANKVVSICNECVYKNNFWSILVVPLAIAILPIFFIIGVIAGGLSADEIATIAYIIFLGPFIISAVIAGILIGKKSYKNIKKQDLYVIGRAYLKKHHKRIDPNGRYSYWDQYPKNAHQIRY